MNPNSFSAAATGTGSAEIISFNATVDASKVKVLSTNKVKGEIPLGEAEIVVSGVADFQFAAAVQAIEGGHCTSPWARTVRAVSDGGRPSS